MEGNVARITFSVLWSVICTFYAFRLLWKPDEIDRQLDKVGKILGKQPSHYKERYGRYRFVGIVLLTSALLTILYALQDMLLL